MSTWTYTPGTIIWKVRLTIGDTDIDPTSDAVFTDEELTYFLTENSNDVNLASADALGAWIAKYATSPDSEKIGDYSYSQKIVEHLNKLKTELEAKIAGIPYLTYAEMDLASVGDVTEMGED